MCTVDEWRRLVAEMMEFRNGLDWRLVDACTQRRVRLASRAAPGGSSWRLGVLLLHAAPKRAYPKHGAGLAVLSCFCAL